MCRTTADVAVSMGGIVYVALAPRWMRSRDSEGETYLRLELGHIVGIPTLVESSGQVPLVVDATVQEELQRVKI